MNTNKKRFKAIDKYVNMSHDERGQLFGFLLAKHPEITKTVINFKPIKGE